jgi:hypothetical protein
MSRIGHVWRSYSGPLSVVAIVAFAVASMSAHMSGPVRWTPDGLFYQEHVYELRGMSHAAAMRREFSSQAAHQVAKQPAFRPVASRRWDWYVTRFFHRRWLVPLMAAALYPVAGDRALLDISILGYTMAGAALLALLRRRFSPGVSLLAAAACLALSAVRAWSALPLTDSWGLALEAGALLAALLAFERGSVWVMVWAVSMLALSFTRDITVVPLIGVLWIALQTRTRRSALVLGTGVAASIPAPAIFGAPLLQSLCFLFQNYRIPSPVSWSYVAAHYPAALWSVIQGDAQYLEGEAVVSAVLLAATAYMLLAAPSRDPFFVLARAAVVGAAVSVAVQPSYTFLRLEMAFVPPIAVGLAFTATRLLDVLRPSRAYSRMPEKRLRSRRVA